MLHTLIPAQERTRLHREYLIRVAVVAMFALAATFFIGCIALLPAFSSALSQNRSATAAVKADANANTITDAAIASATTELRADAVLLEALSGRSAPETFSDLVRRIVSATEPVYVTGITISADRTDSKSVSIGGTAPTREGLLSLKTRLEAAFPGIKVEIPISALAKTSDIQVDVDFQVKSK